MAQPQGMTPAERDEQRYRLLLEMLRLCFRLLDSYDTNDKQKIHE